MTRSLIERIEVACQKADKASSDFDLNPDISLLPDRKLRPAGVLIPLIGDQVILTVRSSALKHHPGQIAFPGGKQDAGDLDVTATALREAHEEIGLLPGNVHVVGSLPQHETVTGFRVTPVIGALHEDFVPVPERGEVDEVFRVPLAHVLDPGNFRVQSRIWQGRERHYFTVPFGPYYIWGATARMLRAWAELMT